MTNHEDRLIQGMAAGGDFRVIAAQTTNLVETARLCQDLAPVAADALGRAMTASVLLARLLDKQVRNQRVTLRFDGNGPLGVVIADATISGGARGYVGNPVPADTTLTVERALGNKGLMTVIRGTPPLGKPYTSQVELEGSGIAQELTRYLAQSEQIASAVMLTVLNKRDGVAAAGGLVVQAFPHTTPEKIAMMEERIRKAPRLSSLLDKMPIEEATAAVLHDIDYKPIDASFNVPLAYTCHCTRERAFAPLALLDPQEIHDMIDEGGTELVCQFCGRKYDITPEELLTLSATHEA